MRIRTLYIVLGLMGLLLATLAIVYGQEQAPLYALPPAREPIYASASMAQPRAGRLVIATNFLNDTISFAQPAQGQLLGELSVGREPRSVAITPDDALAVVLNRGDGTIMVVDIARREVVAEHRVGVLPYALIAPTNNTVLVTLQGASAVVEIQLSDGQILREIPTPPWPAALTKWGDFLYVTHLWDGALSLIYLPDDRIVETLYVGNGFGFTPAFEIDPTTGMGYLLQSRSRAGEPSISYDTSILPVVNLVDLARFRVLRAARIALDVADRPVNMPFAAVVDPARQWLYVVNAGSNDLSILDLRERRARANVPVGVNPRAILLSRDDAFIYVHNAIEGTLMVIETRNLTVQDVLPISDVRIPVDVLIGAELFHTASDARLTIDRRLSCANCHFDGLSDGRVWSGFNTPGLWDLDNRASYTWTGAWDDLHDVETHIRDIQRGIGLVERTALTPTDALSGESLDLDALVAYLSVLRPPSNPNSPTDAAERGEILFQRLSCVTCHSGPSGSDEQGHDVGTGGVYRTPRLRHLWATAPYFHDGSAASLDAVFRLNGAHQLVGQVEEADIADLVAYLLAWPTTE